MMNSGLKYFAGIALLSMLQTPAHANTTNGYMTAGGLGMLPCTEFLNQLGLARQAGIESPQGVTIMNAWVQFAFGYITAFNYAYPGMDDIAASLQNGRKDQSILVMVEGFCRDYPTAKYYEGMSFMIDKLMPTAATGPTQ